MDHLMMALAKIAPKPLLIGMLEEALVQYKANPCEETYNKVGAACFVIVTKQAMADKSIESAVKEVEEIDRIRERLNQNKTVQQ